MPSSICRTSGIVVAFNTTRTDEETPKIWLRQIREKNQEIPVVVCSVTGLCEYEQEPDEAYKERCRAVCAEAGVDFFCVDLRVNDGSLEMMFETLVEKAMERSSARR